MERTYDCQLKLPPLPLPTLSDTCSRYLESVKPFLNEYEYSQTEVQVNLFQSGAGKDLQEKLETIANSSKNWVQDLWYDEYLDYRGPLPLYSNIAGGLQPESDFEQPKLGSQYQRAGLWIHFMAKQYLMAVRQEILIQKQNKVLPMDMSQFANFFCGGRIPGEKRDTQVHYIHLLPKPDGTMEVIANVRHVMILMKGRIFILKVFDGKDNLLTPQNIERQLLKIKEICDREGDGISPGTLTATDRYTWYKLYKHLCILDRQNKVNINVINEAIFGFAFDDVETHDLQSSAHNSILGDCVNRWFDKNCIAVCSSTGLIGSCEDHVHLDGNVGCTILQAPLSEMRRCQFKAKDEDITQNMVDPLELQFTVDDYILQNIKEIQEKHRKLCSSMVIIDKPIIGYGKSYSKSIKIHPDTLVQLALLLGYYTLHKKMVSTYESATTRQFYHGRTETCRSVTLESKQWVESMLDETCDTSERRMLFWKAAKKHIQLMADACSGKGIDRHLFALKKIAEKEGLPVPSLYKDKAWKLSGGDGNFVISSSLSGFIHCHGGLSPMVFDGYGAFYTIETNRVNFNVSAWKDSSETNYEKFYNSCATAFDTIHKMLQNSNL